MLDSTPRPADVVPGTAEYARRERAMRFRRYPNGHRLRRTTHVRCGVIGCQYRAEFCEYGDPKGYCPGASFNYCAAHWVEPSPGGDRSTPRERATRGAS